MKTPELAPLLDRKYWNGIALSDVVDSDEIEQVRHCSKRHKMAEKAILDIYNTSRYPISLAEYNSGDVIRADEHESGAVLHLAEEMITVDQTIPDIAADKILAKPKLHPGGEYLPVRGQVNFPERFNDGSLLVWDKYPGHSYVRETLDEQDQRIHISYLRHHALAVADRGVFHVYNTDNLVRLQDGSIKMPRIFGHSYRAEMSVDRAEIHELRDGRISMLRRVNGAELLTEGTTERKKAKVAFLAAFLNPVNQ